MMMMLLLLLNSLFYIKTIFPHTFNSRFNDILHILFFLLFYSFQRNLIEYQRSFVRCELKQQQQQQQWGGGDVLELKVCREFKSIKS